MLVLRIVEFVGRDRRNSRSGRRGCSATTRQAAFPSSSGRACWPRRLSAWILKSHMRMMPEKGSKGNLDPSRASAPGDADTPVAGRDGPTVLPGFAGDGSWRSVVAGAGLGSGTSDRNSAARDHSRNTERTERGIRRADKSVVAEPLRQKPPCVSAGGTGQRLRLHVRLEPVCVWLPDEGCHTGAPAAPTAGTPSCSPSKPHYTRRVVC